MDLMTKCDLLGVSPSFYLNGQSKMKTVQGGVVTAILSVCIVIASLFFAEKLVFAELTSSVISHRYSSSPRPFTNQDEDFSFFFGIQNLSLERIYRPDLVEVSFSLVNAYKNKTFTQYSLPIHPCEVADFHGNFDSFDKSINFTNAYCVKASETSKFELNSTFGFDNFKSLLISVKPCSQNCAPKEEIDNFLEGFSFDFGFVKDIIDPTNYSNPARKEFDDYFGSASVRYYKAVTVYLQHITVRSDVDWIFTNMEEDNFIGMSKIKEDLILRQRENILDLQVRLDKEERIITRKYYKIQDFLAQIGGITKAIILMGRLIYSHFCKKTMIVSLIKKEKEPSVVSISRSAASISKINETRKEHEFSKKSLFWMGLICWSNKQKDEYEQIEDKFKEKADFGNYFKNMKKLEELVNLRIT